MNEHAPQTKDALLPSLRAFPSKLFVEVTTRCNLGCLMCVKQAEGCAIADSDISPSTFAALEPSFPHLEALVLNGIGEPLLNPRLEEYILTAKKLMPAGSWVGFQTNGLLLTNLRALSLVDAGLDKICLSVDAASPETFRKVREGGELLDIEKAFAALVAAKRNCNSPQVQIGMEFVLMRSNFRELTAAIDWAADHGVSFAIVSHVLPYAEPHAGEAAYNVCSEKALALFTACKSELEREGLDIHRYFNARWKYARTAEEQRIIRIVEAMKSEGERRDVFIDMKKLLRMDITTSGEVEAVFAQATAVARQRGVDLRLPEVTLSEKRHCSFVEEGGAFVSCEGNISPCYFLWHRYRCFASGWLQRVQPRIFGSLEQQGIAEIWNDPLFRSFRKNVLSYDYPNCASCSLAPCDYVQTDTFEQDCHIREVPCGACLWCAGVFQCLK